MKSLIRWSATVGLVGSALIGSLLVTTSQALALPKEQVIQKLRFVPVFTIADGKGAPLVLTPKDAQKTNSVAGAFISYKDAQAFLDRVKTGNPEIAKGGVQVVPISLAEVFQLNQENKGKKDGFGFEYVPSQDQVKTAMDLLQKAGQKGQFAGTPLFVARGGPDKRYLTVAQGDQQVIPLFFRKEDLQQIIERSKQQQPQIASTIDIQVANLEGVMEALQTKDDALVKQIVLVPPQESVEYVQTLMKQTPNQSKPKSIPQK